MTEPSADAIPQFTVIVPTRHRNDLLAACLDRLAPGKQTLDAGAYEVLVTDDGSATTAEQMIREKYPWVRWTAGPRHGPAANRNHAARLARGQWIAFTDDDCLPAPQWLDAYRAAIEPGIDVCEGKTTCTAPIGILDEAPINLTGGCLWSCNFAIRAEVFRAVGGFDESYTFWCEDIDLHRRLRRAGYEFRFVEGAVVEHPPRRRALGFKAGQRWESRVQLWYKEGNRRSTWTWLPVHLLKVRLHQLFDYGFQRATITAAWSAAAEFVYVLAHMPGWERSYRSARQ